MHFAASSLHHSPYYCFCCPVSASHLSRCLGQISARLVKWPASSTACVCVCARGPVCNYHFPLTSAKLPPATTRSPLQHRRCRRHRCVIVVRCCIAMHQRLRVGMQKCKITAATAMGNKINTTLKHFARQRLSSSAVDEMTT